MLEGAEVSSSTKTLQVQRDREKGSEIRGGRDESGECFGDPPAVFPRSRRSSQSECWNIGTTYILTHSSKALNSTASRA